MKSLLIITQKVDEDDDLLGFFIDWLKEFAKKFDYVFVITLAKGKYNLPQNVSVYSLGKEENNSRLTRILKFYKLLFNLVPKSSGLFAHMSPIFAIASWPIAFLFRRKIILWYLHRSVTLRLKLAEKLVYKIVTANKESLNIKSKKIVELGHGINIDLFKMERKWSQEFEKIRILSVGRISPIKNFETLIRAVKELENQGIDFNLKIVGRKIMAQDEKYFEELKKLVDSLNLSNKVEFVGFVPYSKIVNFYRNADIFVNCSPKGGIDKAVLEAMASGLPVFVSNESFKSYLMSYEKEFIFQYNNSFDLAKKLINFLKLNSKEKEMVSNLMYKSILQNHDYKKFIERLSNLYE